MGKTKKIKSPEELNYQLYFGEQLKRLLKKVGVTQLEFAHELDISKNTIWQWIHGLAAPEPLLFRKVVQFFLGHQIPDFNIYDLFMIDEPNITPQTLTQKIDESYKTIEAIKRERQEIDRYWDRVTNECNKRKNDLDKRQDDLDEKEEELERESKTYKETIYVQLSKTLFIRRINDAEYKSVVYNILNNEEIQKLLGHMESQVDKQLGDSNRIYNRIVEEVGKYVKNHIIEHIDRHYSKLI